MRHRIVDRLSCRQHVSRVVSRIASGQIQKLLTPGTCETRPRKQMAAGVCSNPGRKLTASASGIGETFGRKRTVIIKQFVAIAADKLIRILRFI